MMCLDLVITSVSGYSVCVFGILDKIRWEGESGGYCSVRDYGQFITEMSWFKKGIGLSHDWLWLLTIIG